MSGYFYFHFSTSCLGRKLDRADSSVSSPSETLVTRTARLMKDGEKVLHLNLCGCARLDILIQKQLLTVNLAIFVLNCPF